jgi:osmoprotectant transport system permease protein
MNEFLQQYGGMILDKTRDHLVLALLAMIAACAISIPLGVALARCKARKFAKFVISVIGLIQPIPSLALVALVAALFMYLNLPTIGRLPGLVALVGYALLPILRNTYTGIKQVDTNIIEVARGMGMTECQILTNVELPLALPFIMAGVRISMVWTIGVTTLVSLIGASSLGDLIFRGLSRGRVSLILAGAVPAIILALVFEFGLERLERWLTP